MYVSLHTKMVEREKASKDLNFVRDPEVHIRDGDGRFEYKGCRIRYYTDYTGPSPANPEVKYRQPHDIAYVPELNVIVEDCPAATEQFIPLTRPIKIGEQVAKEDLALLNETLIFEKE